MEKINKTTDEQLRKILTPAQYLQYQSQLQKQERHSPAIHSKGVQLQQPCTLSDSCASASDSLPEGYVPVKKPILLTQPQ